MPQIHYVKKAAKDNSVVKKGEPYYWWKTRVTVGKSYHSQMHYSATMPKQSQLATNENLADAYGVQEDIAAAAPDSLTDLAEMRDGWVERINEIRDAVQEKFDNLPEGFQQGQTGEQLQERADALDNWATDLEAVDMEEPEADDFTKEADPANALEIACHDKLAEALEECQGTDPGL